MALKLVPAQVWLFPERLLVDLLQESAASLIEYGQREELPVTQPGQPSIRRLAPQPRPLVFSS